MSLWDSDSVDYAALGFKCGVEIHQQLDTRNKLFCHCPVGLVSYHPDAFVLRHMRPTLSEMGEYDGTALMEKKKSKEIVYQILSNNVCTYEMDDTPPFLVNQQALDIGISLALLFQCKIVDEAHVARKQYLDGSIPTGFQRTILIGTDGWVPYKKRKIRIRQINIEEDACREVSDQGHRIVFRTDRLSTPLIEVITEPHMLNPDEAGEVTKILAETNRISRLVRRGIGTARQDVNVSIKGGSRVEIKGVERIKYIPALTHYEALRQKALLEILEELQKRGISKEQFAYTLNEVTAVIKSPDFSGNWAVRNGGIATAVCIRGYGGILDWRVFPDRTFADEIAGRVRVVACLDKMPNLAHGTSRSALGISDEEWKSISNGLGAGAQDSVIILWGPRKDVETGIGEVIERCREASVGVPNETRQVMRNTRYTDFERILPGPDRMYPDTDHPPISIEEDRIRRLRKAIPELPWKRRERLRLMRLSEELANSLVVHPRFKTFEEMAEISGEPKWAARTVSDDIKSLGRKGYDTAKIEDQHLIDLARYVREKRVFREGTPAVLKAVCLDGCSTDEAISKVVPNPPADIDEMIVASQSGDEHLPSNKDKRFRYLMGRLMLKCRGSFPGELLSMKLSESLRVSEPTG